MSQAVAERESTEVAEIDEAAVAAGALSGLDSDSLILPILKVTQALSAEVSNGEAQQGEFVNSLTGENHGSAVGLIVCGYFKGRFYEDKDNDKVYVAQGEIAPSGWPDEFAGQPFAEIALAEERWKTDSNADVHPWGSGPPIQTTHNYIGLIVDSLELPVRLSLKSTGAKVHNKIATLLRFAPGGTPWSNVLDLKTVQATARGDKRYYEVQVARGRTTSPEERQDAVKLAQQFQASQNVQLQGDEGRGAERKAAEAQGDGLGVV